ncbi:DUF3450 domain-containing protein [Modicisalibacter luteus]|uniref:DUF3450 domain-containing protein n=2 Tax=Modicisalibacter luteus TaxID=453962 RepID=A0ABV7M687_9GAMM|nr:DUF3450 domain-containing protein [Halomonas lutea]
MKQGLLRRSCRLSVVMLLMGACTLALAQNDVREESIEAQREQAELQEKIDAADEATREALRELRAAEREANRLRAYNAELAPLVERQSDAIVQREQALSTLSETREALPVLMRDMVDRLRRWVEADLPFLQEERLARVDELENMLADAEMSASDKLDRVLAAWRTELDYGREMDAWRGQLVGAENREVDYLRLGRVGWYYVAPDGSKGGVWKSRANQWQSLNDEQLAEVRKGIRIAREQRAPELLALPTSIEVSVSGPQKEETS